MQVVHMQTLVSSLSASDCQDSHLQRVTIPEAAYLHRGPPDDERNALETCRGI